MGKHWPAVFALILALGAYVHFDTAFAEEAERKTTSKPGTCPPRTWGAGLCAEFCSSDCDCPDNEKCCSNGCGHQCIAPFTVKLGRCARPQRTNMCAEYCYHDGQCPGEQKCCRTTCGHACSEPC
ncbi:WAP four-disulfide core domain protein 18 [Hippoglossus hippoglossus]|uniref:WAP four-disulfide core domain protein 18 n=1 Tax=Hippoglossus hippoglossus TaxID=8267 RepID=UPI00148DF5E5|nr:WAP four-disulfide core domain protein 18 [Hippoglossus hippoglossus]XP_035015359.2 WAP four-disulfide core domain protein 3 [Hippoglossus stenolepis]